MITIALLLTGSFSIATARAQDAVAQMPLPLVAGAKVVTLWPAGSPTLKNVGQAEGINWIHASNDVQRVINVKVTNVNNPSIELHLAPAEKANGTGMIVAAGGGNRELNIGTEGIDVANWLNSIGTSAFVLRYRLIPYRSDVDALADTQRAIRTVRAHAQEWGVDPGKIGIIGFSAGGEQVGRAVINFDAGNPDASDPVDKESDRPDFAVMVYPGWKQLDLTHMPTNAPPTFLMCAGIDDASHAKATVDFYNALFNAKAPVEMHIYGHGGHGSGLKPRNGIPMGTWQYRFVDWAADLGMMKKAN
jgi:endo-1,4-beta-xylanase